MPKRSIRDRLDRFKAADWRGYLKKNLGIFFFFFKYTKGYRSKIGLSIVSMLISTPMGMIGLFLTRHLIDNVVLNSTKTESERLREFVLILSIQVGLWIIGHLQSIVSTVINWYVDLRITVDVMRDLYDHEQNLSISWHRKRAIGEHMYRTAEDLTDGDIGWQRGGVIGMITNDWVQIFTIIYSIFWAALLFTTIDPVLGIIAAVYLGPWTIITHKLNSWYKKIDFQNREIQQERFAVERDLIVGLKTFKSMGRTRFAANRFVQIMSYCQRIYYKIQASRWVGRDLVMWLFKSMLYNRGIWVYVWINVMMGNYTIGDIAVIWWMLGQVLRPFEQLVNLIQSFRMKMVPAERMMETMLIKPTIVDKPDAVRVHELEGLIALDDVTFGYDESSLLLRNVSMKIEPGTRVAFVGPSGAGKSTIFNLVLRLYDPLGGRVLVDNMDLRDLKLKTYLDRVGVILQETFLFAGTILENIRFGNPFASPDDIEQAVNMADLGEYVKNAPEGLNTFLGEGTNISGGQKQRLGVARAIIRKPSIFIMDEPTAHLDILSETNVIQTIERVTQGHTTLMISHRIAPILFVDKIVVLTPSGVESMGTHAELLQASPTYQKLWNEQQGRAGS